MQTNFDSISGCIKECGMKINGEKSKVVCINEAKKHYTHHNSGLRGNKQSKNNNSQGPDKLNIRHLNTCTLLDLHSSEHV